MGGVQLDDLSLLAKEIWKWCEQRKLWIFSSYISSKDNFEADSESRNLKSNIEFDLSWNGFRLITDQFGKPEMDLFATRQNKKFKNFLSWKKDPNFIAIDALTIS